MARKMTNLLLDYVDEGMLDPMLALRMALTWMSEQEVAEMLEANDLLLEEDEDEDDA